MISFDLFLNKNEEPVGFKCHGHALFDDKGRDIVCAAVSVLVINFVNSAEEFLPDEELKVSVDENEGVIDVKLPPEPGDGLNLLVDSLILGVFGIEDEYGSEFIRVNEIEV